MKVIFWPNVVTTRVHLGPTATNIKALLSKADALGANSYTPGLFIFFADRGRAEELKQYAKASLPPTSRHDVAVAVDEVEFRADLKARLIPQLSNWIEHHPSVP